jgi:hypothetical protein
MTTMAAEASAAEAAIVIVMEFKSVAAVAIEAIVIVMEFKRM